MTAKIGAWEPWLQEPHQQLARILARAKARDADQVAGALLREHGGIGRVLATSWRELRRTAGWRGALAVKRLPRAERAGLVALSDARPRLRTGEDLACFLREIVGLVADGRVLALFVDCDLRLVHLAEASGDCVGTTGVDAAGLIHRAARIGAAGFFLVRTSRLPPGPFDLPPIEPLLQSEPPASLPLIAQMVLGPGEVHFVAV